jgi:hypothetical protein
MTKVASEGWTPDDDAVYLPALSKFGSTARSGTQYGNSPLFFTLDRTVRPFATASVPERAAIVLLVRAVTNLVLSHGRIR